MDDARLKCLCCGALALATLSRYRAIPRVSSDCKPVSAGGELFFCAACGHIQKAATAAFLQDIERIYRDYDSYYQGGGLEQMVADENGARARRSNVLVRRLDVVSALPPKGRCIDIGCGRGAFLRALAERERGLLLYGLELDRRNLAEFERIPGFKALFCGEPNDIPGAYDLISMIHALEHMLDPRATLEALRKKLTPGGLLFIEVPNVEENPFDLVIADHASHFTPRTLDVLLAETGFERLTLSTEWVKKEISVLARTTETPVGRPLADCASTFLTHQLNWLENTLDHAHKAARSAPFGLFGTSIAAVWLTAALADQIDFYLDEDEERQGRYFFGKPVLHPEQAPHGSTVFVGLAPAIAAQIAERLRRLGLRTVLPPDLLVSLP